MKSRYNLRFQPNKPIVSLTKNKNSSNRIIKKSKINSDETIRRHSLRLTSTSKKTKKKKQQQQQQQTISETLPKWRQIENECDNESCSNSSNINDDNFDEILVRHHRLMLEEQKDRKLYERYVRDQRTLRRLQCRRTHTAHLNESTRRRLLRELERERRDAIHDKICSHLTDRTIVFRHGLSNKKSMNWSTLKEEMPYNRYNGTIHEFDVMIENLKRGMKNSSYLTSKPRLSVRERQYQRLASTNSSKPDNSPMSDLPSSCATPPYSILNSPSLQIVSYSPRVPLVRFTDDPNTKFRMNNNSQQLTCIQNVLLHQNIEISSNRKTFLRSKSITNNHFESISTNKRAIEKENFSLHSSPMISMKYSSSRTYPNTRKHPIINNNSLTTRRQTRLSANA